MQNDNYWDDELPSQASRAPNRFWLTLFLFVALLACVGGALLVPSGLGLFVGYQELQTQNHEAAITHFNRGLGYLAEEYPELARTEFEIAVRYDNTFEPAQQKLRELQGVVAGAGTPVAQDDRVAAALFDEAQGLVTQKQWSDAITRLEQLRTLKSDYRKAQVSDLLFQAYVGGGKAAVASGQIELARERFESALTLRAGDADALKQRDLAVLYLDGQQAVGYNWQTAIQKFSALYQQDPNYDDIKKRLFDAYVQYGDLSAKQNASCLAAREYDGALALLNDPAVTQKRAQVMTLCKQVVGATPTAVSVTGNESYTWRVYAIDKPCGGIGDVSGVVNDALGRPLANVTVGYYADGVLLTTKRTDAKGQYQLVWGKDAGLFHLVILGADGKTPVSLQVDVTYPGGNVLGCHIGVDWQRAQ